MYKVWCKYQGYIGVRCTANAEGILKNDADQSDTVLV